MALTKVSRGLLSTGIVDNSNATAITIGSDESVTLAGALTVDTNTLVVDATNNRVGIGTSSPASLMHLSSNAPRLSFTDTNSFTDVNDRFIIRASTDKGNIQWYDDSASTTSELMTFLPSGNVGIGTSSPSDTYNYGKTLDLHGSIGSVVYLRDSDNTSNFGYLAYDGGANRCVIGGGGSAYLRFISAGNEVGRFDASGNLLVGRTSVGSTGNGHVLRGGDSAIFSRNSTGESVIIARNNTPGPALRFNSNGSNIGGIGTHSAGGVELYMGNGSNIGFRFEQTGADRIEPCVGLGQTGRNNAIDLGIAGNQWRDIFCSTVHESSDRSLKQDVEELADAEQRVAVAAKSLLRKYRFISDVEQDDDRYSFGIIAQNLQAAFAAEGLDAANYKMWNEATITDEVTGEERTQQSIVYTQLLAFIISAI